MEWPPSSTELNYIENLFPSERKYMKVASKVSDRCYFKPWKTAFWPLLREDAGTLTNNVSAMQPYRF